MVFHYKCFVLVVLLFLKDAEIMIVAMMMMMMVR